MEMSFFSTILSSLVSVIVTILPFSCSDEGACDSVKDIWNLDEMSLVYSRLTICLKDWMKRERCGFVEAGYMS